MMGDRMLRSRYWIAECPDPSGETDPSTLLIKVTETAPGKLDGRPHEPFEVGCWTGDRDGHLAQPCEPPPADDAR